MKRKTKKRARSPRAEGHMLVFQVAGTAAAVSAALALLGALASTVAPQLGDVEHVKPRRKIKVTAREVKS